MDEAEALIEFISFQLEEIYQVNNTSLLSTPVQYSLTNY